MNRHQQPENHISTAERKQKLLQEGAAFRAAMMNSRNIVRTSLHSCSLLGNLFRGFSSLASPAFSKLGNLHTAKLPPTLLPLLLSSASWIARRGTRKTLIVSSAALAGIGAAVYLSSRNSKGTKDSA